MQENIARNPRVPQQNEMARCVQEVQGVSEDRRGGRQTAHAGRRALNVQGFSECLQGAAEEGRIGETRAAAQRSSQAG